ncbi:6206_t:CDS:1, partial [Funneliformis geosporum]
NVVYKNEFPKLPLFQTNKWLPFISNSRQRQLFLNPIHAVQYLDSTKSMKYDKYRPSISIE